MGLAKAGKCVINQDECKANHWKRTSSAAFNGVPLYANTGTCRQIHAVAETMIQEQIALTDSYSSIRISKTQWYACFSSERKEPSSLAVSPQPTFARIRMVTLNEAGQLHCSCGYTDRNGVPDRHIIHVALNYGISFKGFTHHNDDVRFWRAFDKFVVVGETSEMDSLPTQLQGVDVRAQ